MRAVLAVTLNIDLQFSSLLILTRRERECNGFEHRIAECDLPAAFTLDVLADLNEAVVFLGACEADSRCGVGGLGADGYVLGDGIKGAVI
jgi:hypothetical protein